MLGPGGGASAKAVVIGENMRHRVIPYAKTIGADYYKPSRGTPPGNWLYNNRKWLERQMRNGVHIIDIGPDPRRRALGHISPYYEMEQASIRRRGYARYTWGPLP